MDATFALILCDKRLKSMRRSVKHYLTPWLTHVIPCWSRRLKRQLLNLRTYVSRSRRKLIQRFQIQFLLLKKLNLWWGTPETPLIDLSPWIWNWNVIWIPRLNQFQSVWKSRQTVSCCCNITLENIFSIYCRWRDSYLSFQIPLARNIPGGFILWRKVWFTWLYIICFWCPDGPNFLRRAHGEG